MSQNNILTVTALQQAATAGKANLKANDIEDVDLVLDEIAEQNDQMSQIQDALAQSTMTGVDEMDLEAELDVCSLSPARARLIVRGWRYIFWVSRYCYNGYTATMIEGRDGYNARRPQQHRRRDF